MAKTAIIFGARGRSGQVMARVAQERGYSVLAPTRAEGDLADAEGLTALILGSGAELVVNCAAISGLEACADDASAARLVNALAPAAMARACARTGARFVHLSTDYVLDGRSPGLKAEDAPCRPGCVYGSGKREGEQLVAEANPAALILRVSWLCGNPARPGFPESMAARALAGQPLAAIADKDSLPTDVEELACAALRLAARGQSGLFHLCSTATEGLSWWQCARLVLRELVEYGALAEAPDITRQELAKVPFFREERPRHTAMSNAKLRALGIPMGSAEETIARAVRRYLAARYSGKGGSH